MSAVKIPGVLFLCGCLVIAGCSGSKTEAPPVGSATTTGTTGSAPTPPKSKDVKITDVVVGKGRGAEKGDTIWVQYKGTLADGTEFDANMSPQKDPFSFTLGQSMVIKGWDLGLLGMKVGGERKLHIPSDLAYGANGSGKIPPNAELDFDIKLLGMVKPGEDRIIDITDIKKGSGAREVKLGDTISIQYVGTLLNGRVFDDSHPRGAFTFTVGKAQTLTCIDKGVQGMKVGGVRQIVAPPLTAFIGRPSDNVPYNSEVVFKIELLKIK